MTDILEYYCTAVEEYPVLYCNFGIASHLDYEFSGGIYLDLWLADGVTKLPLGSCKTAGSSREPLHVMVGLLAGFLIETREYAAMYLK